MYASVVYKVRLKSHKKFTQKVHTKHCGRPTTKYLVKTTAPYHLAGAEKICRVLRDVSFFEAVFFHDFFPLLLEKEREKGGEFLLFQTLDQDCPRISVRGEGNQKTNHRPSSCQNCRNYRGRILFAGGNGRRSGAISAGKSFTTAVQL